jgi:type IV pilus assembly protein PilM
LGRPKQYALGKETWMFFSSKKVLGLDIGTNSIKVAEMTVSGRGATLDAFGFAPTPPNSVAAGELTDTTTLGLAVQSLLGDLKSKRKNICTGMWGTAVIVKKISVPKSDEKLIGEQLPFYAEQYIPFDINNISLSHYVIPSGNMADAVDVLLIAAQNELVVQYSQVVANSGASCSILDVSGFALANCFELNYGKIRRETVGVINFGAAVSNFVIISDGEIIFCRDIPVGGLNYTNEISKNMGITIPEAESLKMSAIGGREAPEDVQNIILSTNELITEEIRNSLDFLNATSGNVGLHRLYYTGGSATTPGLIETIQRVTGLRTEPFNPFNKIKFNSRRLSPEYLNQISPYASIAMGLGLRNPGDA